MAGYYAALLQEFLRQSDSEIIGLLLAGIEGERFKTFQVDAAQAWRSELEILRSALAEVLAKRPDTKEWGLVIEYAIPRRQKRIDVVLLMGDIITILEFKSSAADINSCRQVEDYALDLRDFHIPSKGVRIFPVVVAPKFSGRIPVDVLEDRVAPVQWCSPDKLAAKLLSIAGSSVDGNAAQIDITRWNRGHYEAVPTIIEAALAIFAGMEVREITHSHASAENLTRTVDEIVGLAKSARERHEKCICFVTGVPGSGKTLAGLRAVHDPVLQEDPTMAPTFLSGNGPLVRILRASLIEDVMRRQETGLIPRTNAVERERRVRTLIENVHVFGRTHFDDPDQAPPSNHVIVFDEAQRAWNQEQNNKKFKRGISEPEMILTIMSRLDWALVVALIGGGQEINTGEAGLREWGNALSTRFSDWEIRASNEAVRGGASVAGTRLFEGKGRQVQISPALHLPVTQRSYRAQAITEWSNALLKGDPLAAGAALHECADFPVYITRDFNAAKGWLRLAARGSSRCGLVVSSGAARLRAYGVETSTSFHRSYPYHHWFLRGRGDVRASYQLEVAATEFEIQGLELDFVGLCWCNDLLWDGAGWVHRRFNQSRWIKIRKDSDIEFLTNAYRVLLTRARQGMVIWIPPGIKDDSTLDPAEFDHIAEALEASGIRNLPLPLLAKSIAIL
jgi:hypothetical protein